MSRIRGALSRRALEHFHLADPPAPEDPPLTPCQRLALAVLADALHVLYTTRHLGPRPAHPNHAKSHDLREAALAWFQSDDTSHPFAFVSLCEALPTLDPLAIRAELASHDWQGSPHTHHTHFFTHGTATNVVQKRQPPRITARSRLTAGTAARS